MVESSVLLLLVMDASRQLQSRAALIQASSLSRGLMLSGRGSLLAAVVEVRAVVVLHGRLVGVEQSEDGPSGSVEG